MGRTLGRQALQIAAVLLTVLLYNEFLVYYLVLVRCHWPTLRNSSNKPMKAMFLADTHLLGPSGHWWDRLRREWQMQRAFQTSINLHKPEIVFILGDLFDDGKWSSDAAFQEDVRRFHEMFRHPESVKLISLVGNHDIGFHYMVSPHKRQRFVKAVNSSDSVRLLMEGDITFVTANSMAFEGDDCNMCSQARKELSLISGELSCARNGWPDNTNCNKFSNKHSYVAPVLLQHFPMYRESDAMCTGVDSTPEDIKHVKFREKFDCLSKRASKQLMDAVNPRLIISGHTHFFCLREHEGGVEEWSVPSFSWRNIKSPSFLMASLSDTDYDITKCYMPNENTVCMVYFTTVSALVLYILISVAYNRKLYRTNMAKRQR